MLVNLAFLHFICLEIYVVKLLSVWFCYLKNVRISFMQCAVIFQRKLLLKKKHIYDHFFCIPTLPKRCMENDRFVLFYGVHIQFYLVFSFINNNLTKFYYQSRLNLKMLWWHRNVIVHNLSDCYNNGTSNSYKIFFDCLFAVYRVTPLKYFRYFGVYGSLANNCFIHQYFIFKNLFYFVFVRLQNKKTVQKLCNLRSHHKNRITFFMELFTCMCFQVVHRNRKGLSFRTVFIAIRFENYLDVLLSKSESSNAHLFLSLEFVCFWIK